MLNKIKPVTLTLAVAFAITSVYTSCKKSVTNPSKKGVDKKDLSLQLVKNFNSSFTTNLTTSNKKSNAFSKQRVADTNACPVSFNMPVIDFYNDQATGIAYNASGTMSVIFFCSNNQFGYTLVDSVYSTYTTPTYESKMTVKENYTAVAPYAGAATVNGIQWSHVISTTKDQTPHTLDQINNFVLQNISVLVQNNSSVIQGGATSFNITGTYDGESYTYTGTITFLGDNKARVSFSDTTYLVDLNAGTVVIAD